MNRATTPLYAHSPTISNWGRTGLERRYLLLLGGTGGGRTCTLGGQHSLLLLIEDAEEGCYYLWVELAASTAAQFFFCLLDGEGFSIDSARGHGVVGIDDGDDAGADGDCFLCQAGRVAAPVPALVMGYDDAGQKVEDAPGLFQDFATDLGVTAHDGPFFIGKRTGFVQEGVGNTNLTDIVQEGSKSDEVKFLLRAPKLAGGGL